MLKSFFDLTSCLTENLFSVSIMLACSMLNCFLGLSVCLTQDCDWTLVWVTPSVLQKVAWTLGTQRKTSSPCQYFQWRSGKSRRALELSVASSYVIQCYHNNEYSAYHYKLFLCDPVYIAWILSPQSKFNSPKWFNLLRISDQSCVCIYCVLHVQIFISINLFMKCMFWYIKIYILH